jgi:hypothetical protein
MLACPLPRVIRPDTGITEAGEPVVGADQPLDLGACVRLDQAESYFTNDFVTLIASRETSIWCGPRDPDDQQSRYSVRVHQTILPTLEAAAERLGKLFQPCPLPKGIQHRAQSIMDLCSG